MDVQIRSICCCYALAPKTSIIAQALQSIIALQTNCCSAFVGPTNLKLASPEHTTTIQGYLFGETIRLVMGTVTSWEEKGHLTDEH